mmetsp:Transcript_2419/g.2651  ORF Transcript_2419/g.2651 Transcript_2419/m.2651 type:complete len:216 (-) Transcript_2419:3-650(-)
MVKGKVGGKGKGKGQGKGWKVRTTFVKKPIAWEAPKGKGNRKGKGTSKGGKGKGAGGGKWVWIEEEPARRYTQKGGKSKGKGKMATGDRKGKGKGKGKRKAAPLSSTFWQKKVEHEGRKELGETAYPGVIQRYNVKQGWGLIKPDNLSGLPSQVRKKISEAEAKVEESGKEVAEKGLLYFRKPDVNHTEGFKLTGETAVSFRVYVDEKGAGAMDV